MPARPMENHHALRSALLRPPFRTSAFPLHVTLIHPRMSSRGPEFWETRPSERYDAEIEAREVAIVAFDGARWVVVERCALTRSPSRRAAR